MVWEESHAAGTSHTFALASHILFSRPSSGLGEISDDVTQLFALIGSHRHVITLSGL